jgi:hypothetical protein
VEEEEEEEEAEEEAEEEEAEEEEEEDNLPVSLTYDVGLAPQPVWTRSKGVKCLTLRREPNLSSAATLLACPLHLLNYHDFHRRPFSYPNNQTEL